MKIKRNYKIIATIILYGLLLSILMVDNYISRYIFDHTVISNIFYFLLFFLSVKVLTALIHYAYSKRLKIDKTEKNNFYYGINNISNLLIGIGCIVLIFDSFGVDLRTLLTTLSIIAAGIAMITKEYINDYLVGIYYSFSRNIEINDYIKIGNHKGKILEIEMLKIKLLNDNEDLVILPNEMLYSSEIINYTKSMINTMSIDFQLDINLIDEIEILEQGLKNELMEFQEFIEYDSFQLKIINLKKDFIDFKILYKLKTLDVELQNKIRRKTVRKIYNYVFKQDKKRLNPKEGLIYANDSYTNN